MFYIIPAWYKQNTWNENEQCWYVRRTRSEFDDSVKQIQLFHRNNAWPYRLIILGHVPNFRHFLHRQGMFRARYWSCFDAMCEIGRRKAAVFSYRNIQWPDGVIFEYTQFAIVVFFCGEKFAQIEMGEDGNLLRVDMFLGGKLVRSNIYDDRGFVASSIVYKDDTELYQEYLMENGIWKLRRYADDGHVDINPAYPNYLLFYRGEGYHLPYSKLRYDNIEDVINEVLKEYIALTNDEDIFCIAMHEQHMGILKNAMDGRKMVLSFFEERMNLETEGLLEFVQKSEYIVTDTPDTAEQIKELLPQKRNRITDISPYDFRSSANVSQQMQVQKILIPVDRLTAEMFERTIHSVTEYMMENDKLEVHLFSRQSVYNRREILLRRTRDILKKYGYDERMAIEEEKGKAENAIDEEEDKVPIRFKVDQCVDELSVSRCIREQRLYVDMSGRPEQYVQIAAISAGLPQIVISKNQFVRNGENGFIIDGPENICEAFDYYLNSLANWNESMISSYEMGRRYASDALLMKWKGVVTTIG